MKSQKVVGGTPKTFFVYTFSLSCAQGFFIKRTHKYPTWWEHFPMLIVGEDGMCVNEDEVHMKHHSKLITCKFILELYSGNVLNLSETKTANETGPIQSPTKHYEF